MRYLVIAVVLVGCFRSPAPVSSTEDMCGPGASIVAAPLGTMRGGQIPPANTYSIVARDPVTGDLGVAVQSHYLAVGAVAPWAESGVGAVATQSAVETSYGPKGLALMKGGVSAPDAMAQLIAADKGSATRQLGFVDAQGQAASHTGAQCIEFMGSHVGAGYAVQANIMANDRVVPAMAAAYEASRGDLAERLLTALDAAQAAGGDMRGCQSAAILVVSGTRSETPWKERKVDLRVDDHPDPLRELRRMSRIVRANDQLSQGEAAFGKGDRDGALAHYRAAPLMAPGDVEIAFWTAVAIATQGSVDEAIPLMRSTYARNPNWIEVTRRLVAPGILPQAVVDRMLPAGTR